MGWLRPLRSPAGQPRFLVLAKSGSHPSRSRATLVALCQTTGIGGWAGRSDPHAVGRDRRRGRSRNQKLSKAGEERGGRASEVPAPAPQWPLCPASLPTPASQPQHCCHGTFGLAGGWWPLSPVTGRWAQHHLYQKPSPMDQGLCHKPAVLSLFHRRWDPHTCGLQ